MKTIINKTTRRKKAEPPPGCVEWILLKHAKGLTPAELRSLSVVFASWSEQCRRFAEMDENKISSQAHNWTAAPATVGENGAR
jgi:hypothetical protein